MKIEILIFSYLKKYNKTFSTKMKIFKYKQ